MTTESEVEKAINQVELAEQALRRARARLEAVKMEPIQPGVGSVVRFHVRFSASSSSYTYLAYRAVGGRWFVTGRDDEMKWAEVVELMRRDYRIRSGSKALVFDVLPAASAAWEPTTGRD
jgi:hypothetical protein